MSDDIPALERLKQRFLARASEDLAALDQHLAHDDLSADGLRMMVHRLAGAAGTFGYGQVSEAAGGVEDALLRDARDVQTALKRLIQALRAL